MFGKIVPKHYVDKQILLSLIIIIYLVKQNIFFLPKGIIIEIKMLLIQFAAKKATSLSFNSCKIGPWKNRLPNSHFESTTSKLPVKSVNAEAEIPTRG